MSRLRIFSIVAILCISYVVSAYAFPELETLAIPTGKDAVFRPFERNQEVGDDPVTVITITCNVTSSESIVCDNGEDYKPIEHDSGWRRWVDVAICIFLVCFAGLMSGLTMGLMSLDIMNLKIIIKGGEEKQRKYAEKILPLVKRHHLLLVTLLLGNALAMEALPLFLDRLVPAVFAVILSVTFVLLFGEIIPQAVCTRFGLAIGAHLAWLVWTLIVLFFVIAWPVSKLLDCVLGHEDGVVYRRAEMKALLDFQLIGGSGGGSGGGGGGHHNIDNQTGLTPEEVTIIKGAIDLREKKVEAIMTPISEVAMINFDESLDYRVMTKLVDQGHSRYPVYQGNRQNIIGMILVKKLILLNPLDSTPVSRIPLTRLPTIPSSLPLYQVLELFQSGKSHMAVVVDAEDHVTVVGIVTLEDIVEELIQADIWDETDDPMADAAKINKVVAGIRNSMAQLRGGAFSSPISYTLSGVAPGQPKETPHGDIAAAYGSFQKSYQRPPTFLNIPPDQLNYSSDESPRQERRNKQPRSSQQRLNDQPLFSDSDSEASHPHHHSHHKNIQGSSGSAGPTNAYNESNESISITINN